MAIVVDTMIFNIGGSASYAKDTANNRMNMGIIHIDILSNPVKTSGPSVSKNVDIIIMIVTSAMRHPAHPPSLFGSFPMANLLL